MDTIDREPLPGVPQTAFRPAGLLALLMIAAYFGVADPIDLGVSPLALEQGRWWTLVTHMFAHAGLIHLAFNALVLFFLGGPIFARMGQGAMAWARFMLFFLACGLGGAFLYVALNPASFIPAIGASGAVFGFVGLMARLPFMRPGQPMPQVDANGIRPLTGDLLLRNLFLIGILSLAGLVMPIAWEAHLGGFLVGLLLGPLFLQRRNRPVRR